MKISHTAGNERHDKVIMIIQPWTDTGLQRRALDPLVQIVESNRGAWIKGF